MNVALPAEVARLFELYPLEQAMPTLRFPTSSVPAEAVIVENLNLSAAVMAALWLYVGDMDRAHFFAQSEDTSTCAYLHGIVHRREGDYWNSKYWFKRAGKHPILAKWKGFDPFEFVDQVSVSDADNPPDLIDLQRQEWEAIFRHALKESS